MAGKNTYNFPPASTNLSYNDGSGAELSVLPITGAFNSQGENIYRAGPPAPPILGEPSSEGVVQSILHQAAPPQAYLYSAESSLGPPPVIYNPPSLVFEDIYDACVAYVKKHYCYGSRFINRMKLTEIINKGVYYYKLESFGEERATAERFKPYRGEPVDGADQGQPPDPWKMTVDTPTFFEDSETEKIVPHTDIVRLCFICDGRGMVTCWGRKSCNGSGKVKCGDCRGTGSVTDHNNTTVPCYTCDGAGEITCPRCDGRLELVCHRCFGSGALLHYEVLIVTWKNHVSDFLSDTDALPGKVILGAEGVTLLEHQDFSVLPILNFPDEIVKAVTVSLTEEHRSSFPDEMIIRQRHVLQAFPFTRARYNWKEKDGEFYVYGTDRQVYFEDYPQPSCWCTCC